MEEMVRALPEPRELLASSVRCSGNMLFEGPDRGRVLSPLHGT